MTRSRALWLMLAVLLVASLLRLPQLETAPPGLHYDEAANAILAADIGLRGERPVFIESYTGKEVLYFYLAGGMMSAVGSTHGVLRLTSAFLGILTVAATYWVGRELLADRRVAVIAATLVAISFWHLVFSRLGFRAISQPLLQALAVAALFRGLKWRDRAGAWRWYVLSGLFLGLTAYTYLAARLFPAPLLLALLPILWDAVERRARWRNFLLLGAAGLIVLTPLLAYFLQNPETFWVRIVQVAPDGASGSGGASVMQSYLLSLGMLFLSGDPYWRFNVPGMPLFDWFWGGLLVVGWIVALLRWRRWWYAWQKAAVILLTVTPLLMLLPTALATGEIVPSNLRAIGLIPFIFFLPALGMVTLVEGLAEMVRRPDSRLAAFMRYLNLLEGFDVNYAFVVLLTLLLGGVATVRIYFMEWSTRSDLFYSSDGDMAAVATFLDDEAPADATLYVSSPHYRHPTMAFLTDSYERVHWITESGAFVRPVEGEALYVFPHNSPLPAWMAPVFDGAERTIGPPGPNGEALYEAYLVGEDQEGGIDENGLPGQFGDVVKPLWVYAEHGVAGQTVEVTFAWRVLRSSPAPYRLFAQLYDLWGNRWGQTEVMSYAAEQWQAGEIVQQRVAVPLEAGTPPGSYRLHLGFFLDDGTRLERLDDQGRFAGNALIIDSVQVMSGELPASRPVAPEGRPQIVRDGLELLGYAIGGDVVETGASLPLSLWWWATSAQPPMNVRLELIRGDETGVILLNTRPVQSTYPFENWQTPLFLRDTINPRIPVNLEGGTYRLHLRLFDSSGQSVFTSSLGTIEVQETTRLFEAPDVQYPLSASFGSEISLAGYDLEEVASGQYRLRLVWQAQQAVAYDYTVFVHLLREDGSCCIWQSDRMPGQGQYPTSRWVRDEVVVDEYLIMVENDVATGQYGLEVGLYMAETGQRLPVMVPGRETGDALHLEPLDLP